MHLYRLTMFPGLRPTATTLAALVGMGSLLALVPVQAQDTTTPPAANPPGPPTQPPPPPGTEQPAPTQPPAAPAPEGTTAPGASPEAPPTPAPAPPNYNIQYNGLVDGYLQYSLENPAGTLIGGSGRTYDVRIKTPTLALAELNVFKNAKPNGLGFKATFVAGDVAEINHVNLNTTTGQTLGSTGEAQFKNIQQLYATYAFPGAGGGIDVGKFITPFGYEVEEANGDYNYSRSLPYFLLPVYHAGVRIYSPSFNGLTATAYVVNSIFNTTSAGVHDDNNKKGFIGQLNYAAPGGKYTLIGSLGGGKDRFGGVDTQTTVFDGDFTYNINANMLAGLNYTYVKLKPDGGGTDITTNGYAAYFRQALTPKTAYALRFSGFNQDLNTAGTPNPKPNEFTATYELKPATNFTTRLEFRHDTSNVPTFLGKGENAVGGGTKKNQDTLTLAGIFTF